MANGISILEHVNNNIPQSSMLSVTAENSTL